MQPNHSKIGSIQTLRGIAVLAVFLTHTQITNVILELSRIDYSFSTGWLGVELFFVISGFVVTLSLHRGSFNVGSFYIKRIFRLMPSMMVMVALTVLICAAMRQTCLDGPLTPHRASDAWTQG